MIVVDASAVLETLPAGIYDKGNGLSGQFALQKIMRHTCRLWVRIDKTQTEQKRSAYPPIADIGADIVDGNSDQPDSALQQTAWFWATSKFA